MAWNMSNPHIKNLTLNAMKLTKSNNSDLHSYEFTYNEKKT